jgi:hypothetical protein
MSGRQLVTAQRFPADVQLRADSGTGHEPLLDERPFACLTLPKGQSEASSFAGNLSTTLFGSGVGSAEMSSEMHRPRKLTLTLGTGEQLIPGILPGRGIRRQFRRRIGEPEHPPNGLDALLPNASPTKACVASLFSFLPSKLRRELDGQDPPLPAFVGTTPGKRTASGARSSSETFLPLFHFTHRVT